MPILSAGFALLSADFALLSAGFAFLSAGFALVGEREKDWNCQEILSELSCETC